MPDDIRSLTPAEARALIHKYNVLDLQSLGTLDADTAEKLARFKGDYLLLGGLTALDTATAEALAGFKGELDLGGLTTLDAATAKAIAEFKGAGLHLGGLTTLDAATAKAIAEFKGAGLHLGGLTTLDAATAKAIAEFKGPSLHLGGLTTLDTATASALAQFEGGYLNFAQLPALNTATAEALARFKGDIVLRDDEFNPIKEAGRHCFRDGFLESQASTEHNEQAAVPTEIEGLTPERAKEIIAAFKGRHLSLDSVKSLDVSTASVLAQFKGGILSLDDLSVLDSATASALSQFEGGILSLDGLRSLDADTASALAQFKGLTLNLNSLTCLDTATAEAIGKFSGVSLHLRGLTSPNAAVVKSLRQWGKAFCHVDHAEVHASGDKTKQPMPATEQYEQPKENATGFFGNAAKLHDLVSTGDTQSPAGQAAKNFNRFATALAVGGALVGGPGVLLVAPILWWANRKAKHYVENEEKLPLGPDGRPTILMCRYCRSPMSMGCRICARCGRDNFS